MQQALALLPTVPDCGEFAELQTTAEVLGFLAMYARVEGADEVALCEIAVRAAELTRAERRSAATVLRKLGYRAVGDMLRSFKPRT
jgi:hypothetical protein